MEQIIKQYAGERVYTFVSKYVDTTDKKTCVLSTTTIFNVDYLSDSYYTSIINLKRINDTRRINKFFEAVNAKLSVGGKYICCVETSELRKRRILKKYPPVLNYIYFLIDFILKRLIPKIWLLKRIYFSITKGHNRVLSRAEALGRLYSCGFKVLREQCIGRSLYIVAEKTREPYFDYSPSYGIFFKMKRVGKNGKIIYVYKFRTMHPYAEYLQDYIIQLYGYTDIGKPANDFRLTRWGMIFRKYWIDELPQLINVFKGEMRLIGVRPVSQRFLQEYPEDVKQMRLKRKPGCIPPYVALLKQDVKEYIEAERTYLIEKEKHPIWTDFKFFFKAIYNIVTNKIRSA